MELVGNTVYGPMWWANDSLVDLVPSLGTGGGRGGGLVGVLKVMG